MGRKAGLNLERSGYHTKMLNYGKSDLVKVKTKTFRRPNSGWTPAFPSRKDGEGNINLVLHFIRKEQKRNYYKEHPGYRQ